MGNGKNRGITDGDVCPACVEAVKLFKQMKPEYMQRLFKEDILNPLERGDRRRKVCLDCADADTMSRTKGITWKSARLRVAEARLKEMEAPGSQFKGDIEHVLSKQSIAGAVYTHRDWLTSIGYVQVNEAWKKA